MSWRSNEGRLWILDTVWSIGSHINTFQTGFVTVNHKSVCLSWYQSSVPILTTGPFVRVKVVLKEILKDWFVASNTINVHKVFVAFLVSGLLWDFSKCNIYAVAQDFERIFLIYINEKVGASSLLPSSFHTENDSYCRDTLASSCPPPTLPPPQGLISSCVIWL